MLRILEQDAARAETIQQCLQAVTRTEDALVVLKRKGAAGDVRKKLATDQTAQQQPGFGPFGTEESEH